MRWPPVADFVAQVRWSAAGFGARGDRAVRRELVEAEVARHTAPRRTRGLPCVVTATLAAPGSPYGLDLRGDGCSAAQHGVDLNRSTGLVSTGRNTRGGTLSTSVGGPLSTGPYQVKHDGSGPAKRRVGIRGSRGLPRTAAPGRREVMGRAAARGFCAAIAVGVTVTASRLIRLSPFCVRGLHGRSACRRLRTRLLARAVAVNG